MKQGMVEILRGTRERDGATIALCVNPTTGELAHYVVSALGSYEHGNYTHSQAAALQGYLDRLEVGKSPQALRLQGWAVAAFNPEELRGYDPGQLTDYLGSVGNNTIDEACPEDDEEDNIHERLRDAHEP